MLEKLIHSLAVVEDTETKEISLALDTCGGLKKSYLFLVSLTRQIKREDGMRILPLVSNYYVIAPSEQDAISQCESCAFPGQDGCILDENERENLTAVAVRIPFMIRGWSRYSF